MADDEDFGSEAGILVRAADEFGFYGQFNLVFQMLEPMGHHVVIIFAGIFHRLSFFEDAAWLYFL
jgi:hypothetical protein